MGELTLNKLLGSLLAAALVIFGLREMAHVTFAPPYHGSDHGDEHGEEKSLNEQFAEKYAFFVAVEEERADGEPEPVFDLGLALVSADISRGERSFTAKCSTCHSIEEGGANGTGPNLYAMMGAEKKRIDGFNYSSALQDGEVWTYEAMNDWLYNPSAYASGTSMAFAGLRRDDERANVIAYLASMTPGAPAFPDPIPAEAEATGGEAEPAAAEETAPAPVEAVVTEDALAEAPAAAPAPATLEAVVDEAAEEASTLETLIDETAETVETATDEAAEDAAEAAGAVTDE